MIFGWEAIMNGRQVGRSAWLRGTRRQRLVYSRSGYVCAVLLHTEDASLGRAVSAVTLV